MGTNIFENIKHTRLFIQMTKGLDVIPNVISIIIYKCCLGFEAAQHGFDV
jgi:hypothetical protein